MKDFEQLGFDISVQHGVCSVNEHSGSHYNLQNTSFAAVERSRKRLGIHGYTRRHKATAA